MNYQETTTIKKQYGFDFLDKDGNTLSEVTSFGAGAIVALHDEIGDDPNHPKWPEKATAIGGIWEKMVKVTTFKAIPQAIRRNPANGRFMRTSYRENL